MQAPYFNGKTPPPSSDAEQQEIRIGVLVGAMGIVIIVVGALILVATSAAGVNIV